MKQTKEIEARGSGSNVQLAGQKQGEVVRVCAWCDHGKTKGENVSHGICALHKEEMLKAARVHIW